VAARRRINRALAAAFLIAGVAPAAAEVARPPQYVVMAFDNCTEIERWRELTEFAADMNRDRLAPETLAAYRNGEFARAKLPSLSVVDLTP